MSEKRITAEPTRYRPTTIPLVRITHGPWEAEEWPHPGWGDRGHVNRLFAEIEEWWPDELRSDGWYLTPTPAQMVRLIAESETDLQVAIEQYLTGLDPERRWSDPRMQALYEAFAERSLRLEEMCEVVDYALREHDPRGDG